MKDDYMKDEIMVSIICNTYNQQDYIAQTLEGFLKQKVHFNFEILIHDDASDDMTSDIICEYQKKYPKLIKPIYQKENQYKKGVNITNVYQIPRAKGKYIAFCEGDDYWIDDHKLQIQVNALEENLKADMCAHAVKIEQNSIIKGKVAPSNKNEILNVERIILNGGAYIGTCSIMYRSKINENMPRFRREYSIDYTIQIHGALQGGIIYINLEMGVYRIGSKGSWTERVLRQPQKVIEHYYKMLEVLDNINEDTGGKYKDIIEFEKKEYLFKMYYAQNDEKNMKLIARELQQKNNRKIYRFFTLKESLKINIKYLFPFLYKYLHKK